MNAAADPNALAARDAAETEARKWDEAFDFAASEYRALARVLAYVGDSKAPREGSRDCSIESYYYNVGDTIAEAGAPFGAEPLYVDAAERMYDAARERAEGDGR